MASAMLHTHQSKIVSEFITNTTQEFLLLKGEEQGFKKGLGSCIYVKPYKVATRSAYLCLNSFGLTEQ